MNEITIMTTLLILLTITLGILLIATVYCGIISVIEFIDSIKRKYFPKYYYYDYEDEV